MGSFTGFSSLSDDFKPRSRDNLPGHTANKDIGYCDEAGDYAANHCVSSLNYNVTQLLFDTTFIRINKS